jgi:hypothetical protein
MNYKGELALRSQTKNLRRLSIFHECSKSSSDGVVSLYALGDAFVLTMKGPSHFGSTCPVTLSELSGRVRGLLR